MKIEKRLQVLIVVAAAFCFVPLLFFIQDIWDGKYIGYSLQVEGKGPIWEMFIPTRWTLQYYFCLALGFIQDTFGISYKILTNILSCLSLAGICVETARILDQEFGIEREYRLLAVLTILVLPPWATLMSSILFYHMTCIWAFLLATRWRRSAPVPAMVLFIYSLSLNSIFAFAVGYAFFLGIISVDKGNWRRVGLQVCLFSAALLTAFVLYRHYFPPYGYGDGYNSFNLRVSALYNYLGLFAGFLGGAWLLLRNADTAHRQWGFRMVAACCALLFFAGFAYTYVGKPIKLEGTNSFMPRQAFLSAIPTAMLVAVIVRLGVERMGRVIAYGLAGVLLLLSFCYQFAAFQQKYTQMYFENAVAHELLDMRAPQPGFVTFIADRNKVPKYLRDFAGATDFILYEAYGKRPWVTRFCSQSDCSMDDVEKQYWIKRLVNVRGVPLDDLHETRIRIELSHFNPFGSPLVYYYYLTDAFDRLGFKVEYEGVNKLD
ncbi:hypothetical protein OAN24_00180 [Pseudodesulfovibrio sp.]|nr:hypothetical protein [Pseudodesulfovibrio sp.]